MTNIKSPFHLCAEMQEKKHILGNVSRTLKVAFLRQFNLIVASLSSMDYSPIYPIGDIEEKEDKE